MSEIKKKTELDRNLLEQALRLYAGDTVIEQLKLHGHAALTAKPTSQELTVYLQEPKSLTPTKRKITQEEINDFFVRYLDAVCDNITANGGEILSIYGDRVTAVFGRKNPEAGPASACKCAIEYSTIQTQFQDWSFMNRMPIVESKIGIATGEVIYGNNGSSKRKQYTVVGDLVNFVSGLSYMCATYKTPAIIDANTHKAVIDQYTLSHLTDIAVKGWETKQAIYSLTAKTT